jgi:hypothetical protein
VKLHCHSPVNANRGFQRVWYLARYLIFLCLISNTQYAAAHGSVASSDDACLIQIGYLQAHFKIYLPRTHQFEEFCEDLPEVTESLFVMEYAHDALQKMRIDFRIIRDVTGLGKFTRQADVEQIEDLESATVFHQAAAIEPDVFTVVQHFDEPGWYVGIITATTTEDPMEVYTSVFPFEVGFTGLGYWPWFILLIILLQLFHWYTDGTLSRWRDRLKTDSSEINHAL